MPITAGHPGGLDYRVVGQCQTATVDRGNMLFDFAAAAVCVSEAPHHAAQPAVPYPLNVCHKIEFFCNLSVYFRRRHHLISSFILLHYKAMLNRFAKCLKVEKFTLIVKIRCVQFVLFVFLSSLDNDQILLLLNFKIY